MSSFIAVTGLFMVMFGFMGFALWFSRWKQEGRACCSTGIEELLGNEWDPCYTCPKKDTEACDHDEISSEVCEHHDALNVDACALEDATAKK